MEVLPVTLGSIGISLFFLAVGIVLYLFFPISLLKSDPKEEPFTYRHELFIVFLILFIPAMLLTGPKAAMDGNKYCEIEMNYTQSTTVLGLTQVNNTYGLYCFQDTGVANRELYRSEALITHFVWVYLAIMMIFYLIAGWYNGVLRKRGGR